MAGQLLDQADRLMERVACSLCGSSAAVPYLRSYDRSHGQVGEFTFVRCRACGHVYLNPRPTAEEMGAYYPAEYQGYMRAIEDEPNPFVRWNRRWGMAKRCRIITSRRTPGRLLDVGCGTGIFLDAMRRRGWQVEGEDVVPIAAELARERFGLDVFLGPLETAAYPAGRFDAVVLWHVIEHVPDPPATIREIARILKPGGLLVLAAPNVQSFEARLFGARWALWEAPRHLDMFSPQTLGRVLRREGFGSIEQFSSIGTWFGLANSLMYAREEAQGVKVDPGRRYWDMAPWAQPVRLAVIPYTWLTDRLGCGSTMIVCATRCISGHI